MAWRRASTAWGCFARTARSRSSRPPKWYWRAEAFRAPAVRLISRRLTPSMPWVANRPSAAATVVRGGGGVPGGRGPFDRAEADPLDAVGREQRLGGVDEPLGGCHRGR